MTTPGGPVASASATPRILGVTVLYWPPSSAALAIRALARQVDVLVVVDNTPGGAALPLTDEFRSHPRVRWISLGRNLGIAFALNVGVDAAVSEGFDWLATFDQDSDIPDGYVATLLGAVACHDRPGKVGMVVPALADDRLGPGTVTVRRAITSGSITRVEALRATGRYRDDYFIDYVDFEFCVRLRERGYAILRHGAAVLGHRIGAPTASRIGMLRIVTTNHPPVRRYFKCRNRIAMVREHFGSEPAWLTRQVLSTFWEAFKIVLLEREKFAKLSMMARGIADGVAGRMGAGPCEPLSS